MAATTKNCVYGLTLMMVIAFAGICVMSPTATAEEDIWSDELRPMNPESTTRLLNIIAEANPELGKELRQLQKDDPDKFRQQLREAARKHFTELRKRDSEQKTDGKPPEGERPRGPGGGGRRERSRDFFRRRLDNFLTGWFKENYPEKAAELIKLKEDDPESHYRRVASIMRRYGPIMEAERTNPELAEVMKEDIELQKLRNDILKKLKSADDKEAKKLKAELAEVLYQRFDVGLRKKQLKYEQLLKKLEKLKKEIAQQQEELKKLSERKDQAIDERIKELLGKKEKMNWE